MAIALSPKSEIVCYQTPKFKIGDFVTFRNDAGVSFRNKTITGVEYWEGDPEPRYFFYPSGNPSHYSSRERYFILQEEIHEKPAYREVESW